MNTNFKNFTKHHELTKNISFQLVPYGNTEKAMEEYKIVETDRAIRDTVSRVQVIADRYHAVFATEVLAGFKADWTELETALENKDAKEIEKQTEKTVKQLSDAFKKSSDYKKLNKSDFLKEVLPKFAKEEEQSDIETAALFQTFFIKYYQRKLRVYEPSMKHGSIGERIISNFSIFLKNKKVYEELPSGLRREMDSLLSFDPFQTDYYNNCLTQDGIEAYNSLFSGIYENKNDSPVCVQTGFNQIINEYTQKHKKRLPVFTPLARQIGTDHEKEAFIVRLEDDSQARMLLKSFVNSLDGIGELLPLMDFGSTDYDCDRIYFKKYEVSRLSHLICEKWNILLSGTESILKESCNYDELLKKSEMKAERELNKRLKELRNSAGECISAYNRAKADCLIDGLLPAGQVYVNKLQKQYEAVLKKRTALMPYLKDGVKLFGDEKASDAIRKFLETATEFYRMVSLFDRSAADFDGVYLSVLNGIFERFETLPGIHTKIKSYMTRKLKDIFKKELLSFANHELMVGGWTENEKMQRIIRPTILRRKDATGIDHYYYLVRNKMNTKVKLIADKQVPFADHFEKMKYNQLDPVKQIPRMVFTDGAKEHFEENETDYMIKNVALKKEVYEFLKRDAVTGQYPFTKAFITETKDEERYRKALYLWIDLCREIIEKNTVFDISNLRATETFENLNDFYNELSPMLYKLSWSEYIPTEELHRVINNGGAFVFEITSKGLREILYKQKKNKDEQAAYLLEALSGKANPLVKLNGLPTVFYRPAGLDKNKVPVHKKGSRLVGRTTTENKPIPEDIYRELYLYVNDRQKELSEEAKEYLPKLRVREAEYDIVKKRRYTKDMFILNISVQLNFGAVPEKTVNNMANDYIRENEVNYLSVTRGQRNLLTVVITDKNKNVILEENLNEIKGVDFKERLTLLEKTRDEEEADWRQKSAIANLKTRYIEMAASHIANLAVEYNALICIEEISQALKREMCAVEASVFSVFEEKLVKKLQCLSLKDAPDDEPGGCLMPLQLSHQDMTGGLQNGILFNISPSYTATVDPNTGFVPLIKFDANTKEERIRLLNRFGYRYDDSVNVFRLNLDYKDFSYIIPLSKTEWEVTSAGLRSVYDREEKKYVLHDITEEMFMLFEKYGLPGNIQKGDFPKDLSQKAVKDIYEVVRLIFQMRNYSETETWIVSCVEKDAKYYDSRHGSLKTTDSLKGYLLSEKLKYAVDVIRNSEEVKWKDMAMTSEKWLNLLAEVV